MLQADAAEDDIFSYKAQRWLWNEPEQFQRRYRKFDIEALAQAAEKAAGPGAKCAEVTKLPEGNFNKTLLVRMHDGRQFIARLPNPNAGQPHYTTASESPNDLTTKHWLIYRIGERSSPDSCSESIGLQYTSKHQ
jgi:hypothetical protein